MLSHPSLPYTTSAPFIKYQTRTTQERQRKERAACTHVVGSVVELPSNKIRTTVRIQRTSWLGGLEHFMTQFACLAGTCMEGNRRIKNMRIVQEKKNKERKSSLLLLFLSCSSLLLHSYLYAFCIIANRGANPASVKSVGMHYSRHATAAT